MHRPARAAHESSQQWRVDGIDAIAQVARERSDRRAIGAEAASGRVGAKHHAAALQVDAAFGEAEVGANEVGVDHRVAVELNQVVAVRANRGFVQDSSFAETRVRLPHVVQRHGKTLRLTLDECGRIGARSVVGNENLGGQHGLRANRLEHDSQRRHPVIRRNKKRAGRR